MKLIKEYNEFLILERFEKNIKSELIKLGIDDPKELEIMIDQSRNGNLGNYIRNSGGNFTFGMLRALFLDAQETKTRTELKVGFIKAIHRIVPMALAPFFPILAIVGYILGTSRAFNKIISPILADPGKDFPQFLYKIIKGTMKVAEGELIEGDKFTDAFVVSDNLVNALKESTLRDFAIYLSNKMDKKDPKLEVPEHYVENELKSYLNKRYDVEPPIPLKNK